MASSLDLNNVQGDILAGLPKKTETYFLFQIEDAHVQEFRRQLGKLVPLITTTAQVVDDRARIAQHKRDVAAGKVKPGLLPLSGINLAFSRKGLEKIEIRDEIGDSTFNKGMLDDAKELGDAGTSSPEGFEPSWDPEFKQDIHGLILITGDCHATVDRSLARIKQIFSVGKQDATIHEVVTIVGDVRPGEVSAHEHFGFLDGVSQPAVQGFHTSPNPGQELIRQGIILLGREGDKPDVSGVTQRPSWALDGSFLCFRYLEQKVPEFNKFLTDKALTINDPSAPPDLGRELLGARLVGRWKSGAPVDVTPLRDDPTLGTDPSRNDKFRYDPNSQERCPYAAHTRKTNPRDDLPSTEAKRILRRGIQFGPEVTADEAASNTTALQRGLLFVCYQSNIFNGFRFIQTLWANNVNFPFDKENVPTPGFDAIIGQTNDLVGPRSMLGSNPNDLNASLILSEHWVNTRGGEYLFSPSLRALRETFALAE